MLPRWLVLPKGRALREAAHVGDDAIIDSGNMVWEALFFASGLSRFAEASLTAAVVVAIPNAPYGTRTNRSAKGPVNLRGNIIEGLHGHLLLNMQRELAWRARRAASERRRSASS